MEAFEDEVTSQEEDKSWRPPTLMQPKPMPETKCGRPRLAGVRPILAKKSIAIYIQLYSYVAPVRLRKFAKGMGVMPSLAYICEGYMRNANLPCEKECVFM